MTIIQPNKEKKSGILTVVICLFAAASVGMTVFCGCLYSKTVSFQNSIAVSEKSIEESRTENAELKNKLFKITDPQLIEEIAGEKGLVKDTDPRWVLASF